MKHSSAAEGANQKRFRSTHSEDSGAEAKEQMHLHVQDFAGGPLRQESAGYAPSINRSL